MPRLDRNKRPSRLARWIRRAKLLAILALLVAGGLFAMSDRAAQLAETWQHDAEDVTLAAGYRVEHLMFTGRVHLPEAQLVEALGVGRGDPILAFDPAAARDRLEALPWVLRATVERRLPDTVEVRLEERAALAVWQHDRRFSLISADGAVLGREEADKFQNLPVVVGPDAPQHAAQLLDDLKPVPAVAQRVQAAVRVGQRRWDLHLDNGVVVKLPEQGQAPALRRLAELEQAHALAERDVVAIDLRLPDRPTVETAHGLPTQAKPAAGRGV